MCNFLLVKICEIYILLCDLVWFTSSSLIHGPPYTQFLAPPLALKSEQDKVAPTIVVGGQRIEDEQNKGADVFSSSGLYVEVGDGGSGINVASSIAVNRAVAQRASNRGRRGKHGHAPGHRQRCVRRCQQRLTGQPARQPARALGRQHHQRKEAEPWMAEGKKRKGEVTGS